MPPKVRCGMSVWGAGRRKYEQIGGHVDIGPPMESLYGKKRKGTSSAQQATAKGKKAHDVESSSDGDSTEDEQVKNGASKSLEKKLVEVMDVNKRVMDIIDEAPKHCTFELEDIVYLVDQRNKFTKVAIGKITGKPGMEYLPDILVVEGWYRVCVIEVYHPQTPLQWPNASKSMFNLLQVVNMNTLWGEECIVPVE